MSGFHNCRACITEVACEKAARCFNGSSALPPPEPQGHLERSRLATCSLPVSLVEKTIRRLQQATRIAQSSGCYLSADGFDSLVCELRAEAGLTTERQPEENASGETRRGEPRKTLNSKTNMENQTATDSGTIPAVVSSDLLGDSELTKITTVTKWQTSDGKEHYSLNCAQYHARQMALAAKANAVLDSGGSVADALRAGEWPGSIEPVLERVTKATKLVIQHWQCRDTPGYQVCAVHSDWKFRVWGNAGCWSGSYGGNVSVADLARYASHERTDFA